MAEELRRSNRTVRLRRDSSYYYDEKVISALTQSDNIGNWQHSSDSEASNCVNTNNISSVVETVINPDVTAISWSNVIFNPCEVEISANKPLSLSLENLNSFLDNLGPSRSITTNTHSASISDSVKNINISR